MSNKDKKYYFIYIFWLLFFILLTNQHYNFNEIIKINQLDSVSYMEIANNSPYYSSEILTYHHAQRFFFPYLIGIFSNVSNLEVFQSFKIFTLIILLLIIYIHFLILKKLKIDLFFSILSVSLLVLNPYIFRYFIAVPTMINDTIFILSIYLFLFGIKFKNNYTLLSIFLSLISRQNGIFLFLANLINLYFIYKNEFIKSKNFILSILVLIFTFYISNHYASEVSIERFKYKHIYGIFEWVLVKWNFFEFISWILISFYSYLPIIFIFLVYRKFKNFQKKDLKDHIVLIFLFFTIIGMPFLSGPDLAGRNIIRLTTLAYPIILVWMLYFLDTKKKNFNKSLQIILIFILHIWSLHPTYSNIPLFSSLRDYLF